MTINISRRSKSNILYAIAWLTIIISLLPILWLFIGAVKTAAELWAYPPKFVPDHPTLKNFAKVLSGHDSRLPFLINSLLISIISTIITIVLAVPASYGFARMKIKGGKHLEFWILSTRMMPQIASLIPIFIIIRKVGLFDTYAGLILVYTMFNVSYAVWMLTVFFRKLPYQVEEAALIDGCSSWQVFTRVAIPLILPSIMTVAAFIFTFCWNELIFALILTGNVAKTLPVAISEYTNGNFFRWELITASATIQVIPAIIIVVIMQRYIVSGLTMGAVKQ